MSDRPARPLHVALAFQLGLFTRDDVADWVGARILAIDVVPDALLELTTLARKDENEIERLLERLEPSVKDAERARVGFAIVREMLAGARIDTRGAIDMLRRLGDLLPWEVQCTIMALDDYCDLAVRGTYGNVADVHHELLQLLASHAD